MIYRIDHACGHAADASLFGKHSERESRAAWLARGVCSECYKAAKAEAATEATSGLPALTGTEKQVAWATTIRAEVKAALLELLGRLVQAGLPAGLIEAAKADDEMAWLGIADFVEGKGGKEGWIWRAVPQFLGRTEAKTWIDERGVVPAKALKAFAEAK